MTVLDFGQTIGGVFQTAFIVEDLKTAMDEFTKKLNVGPWFVAGPFVPPRGVYRGEPTDMRVEIAVGHAGHMQYELIQQHDDKPSVFMEVAKSRGYGFHHFGKLTTDLEGDVARFQAQGFELAFSDFSPRGAEIRYIDTLSVLPGMTELVEYSPAIEAIYTEYYRASVGWDGTDPIRRAKLPRPPE